jgi:phytoene dehydrogenase-like protein
VTYDTVIIGAGLSGLAAGIRLAYFDRSVCIVERHTTIGGLNSFYRLRKRDFDVGLHAVTNYAEPGTKTGPLSKLLRQLRLRWNDFDLRPQIESSVVFPERTLRFTNEFDFLHQQVVEQFPNQRDGFATLLQRIEQHDPLDLSRVETSARTTLGECLSDPMLVDMLLCPLMFYGSATEHDMDFNQFVIMFRSIFQEGFGRPFAGVRPIMKAVVKQFRSLGGELKLRAGVDSIQTENGRAVGVTLEDGTEIVARNVVSSTGANETMKLCGEVADQDDDQYRAGEISFVEAIFSLDRTPAELGHHQTIVFYSDVPELHYGRPAEPVDLRSGIICSPNNFQYDEPLTEGCLRLTALADPAAWMDRDPTQFTEADYTAAKEQWCEGMVAGAVKHIPDFRPHIVDTDMFTPRTIRKFTGHINGCVYGSPHKFVDGQTGVDNLYLCGTDQGFLGIVGSMLSGITIANRYLLG